MPSHSKCERRTWFVTCTKLNREIMSGVRCFDSERISVRDTRTPLKDATSIPFSASVVWIVPLLCWKILQSETLDQMFAFYQCSFGSLTPSSCLPDCQFQLAVDSPPIRVVISSKTLEFDDHERSSSNQSEKDDQWYDNCHGQNSNRQPIIVTLFIEVTA